MNRLIFDTLTFLNGFIAILLIIVGAWLGSNMPIFLSVRLVGAVVGGLVGLGSAAAVCGSLAFFVLVEKHLRTIAESSGEPRYSDSVDGETGRREPTL